MPRREAGSTFSLAHYVKILNLMLVKHYDFRLVGDSTGEDTDKTIFMRHDIDFSLNAAQVMAQREQACGVKSTFYFMIRSNFYNLFSPEAKQTVCDISNLGHRVGLHFWYGANEMGNLDLHHLEEVIQSEFSMIEYYYGNIFSRTVSFHNPPKEVLGLRLENCVNAYDDKYFKDIKYLSESNQNWREGDLYQIIEEGRYNRLQILIHPVLWVFGCHSIRDTMEAFLACERSNIERFIREDGIPF